MNTLSEHSFSPCAGASGEPPWPFVSVIVPTRNRRGLLRDCLQSIMELDYPATEFEILVVDDGSTDGTAEMLAELQQKRTRPRMTVLRHRERLGPNRSRNTAIRKAKGAWVCLIDDDELVPRQLLRVFLRFLLSRPDVDGASGGCRQRYEAGPQRLICSRCKSVYKTQFYPGGENEYVACEFATTGCVTIRKDAFERFGYLDERHYGLGLDVEWFGRASRQGGRFVMLRDAFVWHRVVPEDFQWSTLYERHVRRSRGWARSRSLLRWQDPWTKDFSQGVLCLLHAVRYGCLKGLILALGSFAVAWRWRAESRRLATRE